jgi:hypothetical protein
VLTISPKALDYIIARGQTLHLEQPPRATGCCVSIQEAPAPRLGKPRDESRYQLREIQGISCYLPRSFPEDRPLAISLRSFLGLRWLELDGWSVL